MFEQATQILTAVHTKFHKDEERERIERRLQKNRDLLSLHEIETLLQCGYITSLMDTAAAALVDDFARPIGPLQFTAMRDVLILVMQVTSLKRVKEFAATSHETQADASSSGGWSGRIC